MATTTDLEKDEQSKNVDIKLCRSMIGSLLHLTASRSDIMFSICLCVIFHSFPKESHLITVKRIIRYLKGIIGMSLWNQKTGQFSMTGFSDADYADCRVDKKSIRTCQFLRNCLVSWSFKK